MERSKLGFAFPPGARMIPDSVVVRANGQILKAGEDYEVQVYDATAKRPKCDGIIFFSKDPLPGDMLSFSYKGVEHVRLIPGVPQTETIVMLPEEDS